MVLFVLVGEASFSSSFKYFLLQVQLCFLLGDEVDQSYRRCDWAVVAGDSNGISINFAGFDLFLILLTD